MQLKVFISILRFLPQIYKIDSEVDAKQESFEPYETSLYPVYQQLVDGPTIYDVLNSPAIEQVKSRKDAFSVDAPAFRPRYDSITHISDRHDEQRMNVYKVSMPKTVCLLNVFIYHHANMLLPLLFKTFQVFINKCAVLDPKPPFIHCLIQPRQGKCTLQIGNINLNIDSINISIVFLTKTHSRILQD